MLEAGCKAKQLWKTPRHVDATYNPSIEETEADNHGLNACLSYKYFVSKVKQKKMNSKNNKNP